MACGASQWWEFIEAETSFLHGTQGSSKYLAFAATCVNVFWTFTLQGLSFLHLFNSSYHRYLTNFMTTEIVTSAFAFLFSAQDPKDILYHGIFINVFTLYSNNLLFGPYFSLFPSKLLHLPILPGNFQSLSVKYSFWERLTRQMFFPKSMSSQLDLTFLRIIIINSWEYRHKIYDMPFFGGDDQFRSKSSLKCNFFLCGSFVGLHLMFIETDATVSQFRFGLSFSCKGTFCLAPHRAWV